MYNYIGIINKSSAVTKAISCNFLNNQNSKLNLVLAKGNIIEIYNVTKDGLIATPYLNVYGKIILLEKIPAGSNENSNNNILNSSNVATSDNIFIMTEDLDFSIISYNKIKNEIVNLDKGTIREDIGKRQDKIHSVFEDNYDYAVISAYKNIFKIVHLRNRNKNEDFSIRYEYEDLLLLFPFNTGLESNINSSNVNITTTEINSQIPKFNILKKDNKIVNPLITNQVNISGISSYKSTRSQTFAMINVVNNYNQENKKVKLESFYFNLFKQEVHKDVTPGLDLTSNPTCSTIICPKVGGLIIFYSNFLKYYKLSSSNSRLSESDTKVYSDRKFITHCEIDKLRYLVVDEFGNLFLLALKSSNINNIENSENNYSLIFQFLGEINYASTLTYLDNNFIFIGSDKANSQLIRITKTPTNITTRPFIEIIEEYESLAPISDFCLLNNTNDEGGQEILCVSGTEKSCSLKTIRKGTSMNVEAEIPLFNVKSLFTANFYDNCNNSMIIDGINDGENKTKNTLIFANYIDRTCLLSFDYINFSISNYYHDNIFLAEPTIFVCEYSQENKNFIIQVTMSYLIIYDENLNILSKLSTIIPPVIIKMKNKKGFLYIYNKNNLLIRYNLKEIINKKEFEINYTPEILNDDFLISAMEVTEDLIVFSQWHINKVFLFSIKTKKTEILCEFENILVCNSIAIIKNEGIKFLFIALSNGKILYYKLKTSIAKNLSSYTYSHEDFVLKRKYNISNEAFEIKKVKVKGKDFLFLNTDLPALVTLNKENPHFSNFNVKECQDLISIGNNLNLFLFKEAIYIGSLSNAQSQNIVTKQIGKSIYNLTNINLTQDTGNNLNLIAFTQEEKREDDNSICSFVIMDKHFNEISKFIFDIENEMCTTFVELNENVYEDLNENLKKKKLFALGTGIITSQIEEPEIGHIYLIEMDENFKLRKIGEIETKGPVYKIATRNNLIFVAICSTLFVYNLILKNKQCELKLIRKNNDFTIINDILIHDEFILVSDIHKSITIFKFDEEKEKLIECCRDFNPIWCYSFTKVDNSHYLVGDIDGNVFGLRRELKPKTDEESYSLERVSQINLGERINKMNCVIKKINSKDWENIFNYSNKNSGILFNSNNNCNLITNSVYMTYFGTLEGSFGIMVSIPKDTFEFLYTLQNEIVKVISSTGNFEYEKWRAFKDGFITDFSKGFIEGTILQEFLNFDNSYRVEFLKNMKYPWQKNINETINLIESLLKMH